MRRFLASCSVVLVAVVLFGACRGSGPKDSGSSDTKGDSSNSDFAQRYEDAAKQKFKITFKTGDEEDKTYAQDGNGNSVYTAGDSQTFTSSSGTVVCTTTSGAPTCGKVAAGQTPTAFLGLYNAGRTYLNALGGKLGDVSSKTVAGRDAQCATISAKSIGGALGGALISGFKGSGTYCIDKDTGVLLEISSTDAAGDESTAFIVTKFEEPSASEFTPPATAQTTTGYTLPGD